VALEGWHVPQRPASVLPGGRGAGYGSLRWRTWPSSPCGPRIAVGALREPRGPIPAKG
jgi:hypothetical protein